MASNSKTRHSLQRLRRLARRRRTAEVLAKTVAGKTEVKPKK